LVTKGGLKKKKESVLYKETTSNAGPLKPEKKLRLNQKNVERKATSRKEKKEALMRATLTKPHTSVDQRETYNPLHQVTRPAGPLTI